MRRIDQPGEAIPGLVRVKPPGTIRFVTCSLVVAVAAACATAVEPVRVESTVPPLEDRFAEARAELLEAINEDRGREGLNPLELDPLASRVAQSHAEWLVLEDRWSHYGIGGRAPYERYAEAGGRGHVRENLYRQQELTTDPALVGDPWERFDPREAELALLASRGHREAILDPSRTHVGLGFAVSPSRGEIVVVQELVARHAIVEVRSQGWRTAPVPIRGRMLEEGTRPLLVALHRVPAVRAWYARGAPPPRGPYDDGGEPAGVIPAWDIEWRSGDRSFEAEVPPRFSSGTGRYYGIVYVAPAREVGEAVRNRLSRGVSTDMGWPGAAFVVDVF